MVTADEMPGGKGHDPPHPESCEGAFAQSTPSRGLRIAFLVLCTVGVLLSADLLRLHVRVHTDPNYHSLCAISETIDCESVAFSSYAVFAGLPVALWGLLGYLVMGGLSIRGLYRYQGKSVWPFGMLFWMSLFASLVSVILFSVSAKWIQSLCVICIVTYVVNFALLALAFAELKRLRLGPFSALREEIQHYSRRRHGLSAYVIAVAGALGVLYIAIPLYWQTEITQGPGACSPGERPMGLAGSAHENRSSRSPSSTIISVRFACGATCWRESLFMSTRTGFGSSIITFRCSSIPRRFSMPKSLSVQGNRENSGNPMIFCSPMDGGRTRSHPGKYHQPWGSIRKN